MRWGLLTPARRLRARASAGADQKQSLIWRFSATEHARWQMSSFGSNRTARGVCASVWRRAGPETSNEPVIC